MILKGFVKKKNEMLVKKLSVLYKMEIYNTKENRWPILNIHKSEG